MTHVLTSAKSGITLKDKFIIVISLQDYPSSTPALFEVELTYRECYPNSFAGPMIDDMVIRVGEPGPTIDFLFDQSPCSWEQTYDMQVTRMTKDPLSD